MATIYLRGSNDPFRSMARAHHRLHVGGKHGLDVLKLVPLQRKTYILQLCDPHFSLYIYIYSNIVIIIYIDYSKIIIKAS